MRSLKAAELLLLWERGLNIPLWELGQALLAAACPEMDQAGIAELSIGERDSRLLQLRERMFGSDLFNTAICPQCSQQVEWKNRIEDFRVEQSSDPSLSGEFNLKTKDYLLCFRLPSSMDIALVIKHHRNHSMPKELAKRCIVSALHDGEAYDPDLLPDNVLLALERRIEELDQQAEIRIDLICPQCSHQWVALFDIASFFMGRD